MKSCGVILSGGKSSRMGKNKSLLSLHNKPVIEHIALVLNECTDNIIVIANETDKYSFLGLPVYKDRYKNKGPLGGLEAALHYSKADVFLFAACDMPFINQDVYNYLLDQLNDYDAVIPIYENKMHPLAGIYRRSILPKIQQQLDMDDRKVRNLFKYMKVNYIHRFAPLSENLLQRHFFNMNFPAQYEQAKLL
ncbi:molybdenum cofactor guanylyltransferase [Virgibacillus oceani]|uniref:Probable molybdenum cofactor guanylyltransferase n=1 Tax=Virgibacillus oceani TaxID=1479511 RepID=A0A917H2W4_9BACI|nr:molybdenum cofactor guanylyltransferase [Virgibacillus oceani]GGG65685.1 molybdenum cofactor guanylyltransferase [Virgibacillus oceani]